jgi:hypothetical protein
MSILELKRKARDRAARIRQAANTFLPLVESVEPCFANRCELVTVLHENSLTYALEEYLRVESIKHAPDFPLGVSEIEN